MDVTNIDAGERQFTAQDQIDAKLMTYRNPSEGSARGWNECPAVVPVIPKFTSLVFTSYPEYCEEGERMTRAEVVSLFFTSQDFSAG